MVSAGSCSPDAGKVHRHTPIGPRLSTPPAPRETRNTERDPATPRLGIRRTDQEGLYLDDLPVLLFAACAPFDGNRLRPCIYDIAKFLEPVSIRESHAPRLLQDCSKTTPKKKVALSRLTNQSSNTFLSSGYHLMSLTNATPLEVAKAARIGSRSLAVLSTRERNAALTAIHAALADGKDEVLAANKQDLEDANKAAAGGTLSQSLVKRLDLGKKGKYEDMLQGILDVRELEDPSMSAPHGSCLTAHSFQSIRLQPGHFSTTT